MPGARRATTVLAAPPAATTTAMIDPPLTDAEQAEAEIERQTLARRLLAAFDAGIIDDEDLADEPDETLAMITCPECGAKMPEGTKTCPDCGHDMTKDGEAADTEPLADAPVDAEDITDGGDDEATEIDPANPGGFRAVLCVEMERTADNRMIGENATTWRTPPLALMLMDTSGHGGMAGPAVLCGTHDEITRDGLSIESIGHFLANDDMGTRAAKLVRDGAMDSNSIDGGDVEWEFIVEEMDEDGYPTKGLDLMTAVTILGSTLVPFPAIESAKVQYLAASGASMPNEPVIRYSMKFEYLTPAALTAAVTPPAATIEAEVTFSADEIAEVVSDVAESLVASGQIRFPIAMFENPHFDGPTPIEIGDDGSVRGHLALWGQCHIGFDRECVLAPRSRTDYAQFRLGHVRTEEGTSQPIGTITMGGGHAADHLSAAAAREHYDSTSTGVAYVSAGEDEHGIWIAGVLKPGLSDERITELGAASLSGDWRNIGGNLELIAALAVNCPGFPVARVRHGEVLALVAAGYGHQKPTVSYLETRLERVVATSEERFAAMESRLDELTAANAALAARVNPIAAAEIAARFTS